ncbi:hypothetical protein JCM5353_008774 [Sporobolomyces roseus]
MARDRERLIQQVQDQGGYYGDRDAFERNRLRDYPALKDVYLDYAASPPAPITPVQRFATTLASTLYANPHSASTSGAETSLLIEKTRSRVLSELFNVPSSELDKWDIVFTQGGATRGIQIVGDAWNWRRSEANEDGKVGLRYLVESHTSLVELRGIALSRPRFGVDFAKKIKRADPGGVVLVDAAAYCATKILDLGSVGDEYAPDAIVGSFYKIFGWPTSLGFLIIRRSSSHHFLSTPHFGGGSISSLSLSSPFSVTSRTSSNPTNPTNHQRNLRWKEVELHVSALRKMAKAMLEELRHEACQGGEEGPVFVEHQAFQPLPSDTIPLPSDLQPSLEAPGPTIAIVNGISLRTGGLCNKGVWARVFGVVGEELREWEKTGRATAVSEEYSPFYPYRPLGIARISFGAASTVDDVLAFVAFVKKFFVRGEEVVQLGLKEKADSSSVGGNKGVRAARLGTLLLHPIKSCASQSILPEISPEGWPITSTGLLYDREFMLVDPSSGKALSQKKYPRMALIKPSIDLERGILRKDANHRSARGETLDEVTSSPQTKVDLDRDRVKGERDPLIPFAWTLSQLRRLPLDSTSRHAHFDSSPSSLPTVPLPLRLSNESPFLFVADSSVRQVKNWISTSSTVQVHHTAFRPNPIIDDLDLSTARHVETFWEDAADLVKIGELVFANLGRCRRCLMVGINSVTGERTKEPLSTLSKHRKSTKNGRVECGSYMYWREDLVAG